jgi:hypothetical protein
MSLTSGKFAEMEFAMFCKRTVFSRSRRRDNQPALAKTHRRQEIDRAHRDVLLDLGRFQENPLQRIIRYQFFKRGDRVRLFRWPLHDALKPYDGRTTIITDRGLHEDLNLVAPLQAVTLDQRFGHIGILGIKAVVDVLMHHETMATVRQVQPTSVTNRPLLLHGGVQDFGDDLPAGHLTLKRTPDSARKGHEIRQIQGIKRIQPKGLSGTLLQGFRQGVQCPQIRKSSRIRKISQSGRHRRRRRLRGVLRTPSTSVSRFVARIRLPRFAVLVPLVLLQLLPVVASSKLSIGKTTRTAVALILISALRRRLSPGTV